MKPSLPCAIPPIASLLLLGCGAPPPPPATGSPYDARDDGSPSEQAAAPSPATGSPHDGVATRSGAPGLGVEAMRPALRGAALTDEEVLFIDRALRASRTDYTEQGLETFVEWQLVAEVTREERAFRLFVAGARVNAEWELFIDRTTGEVTLGTVATEAPAPPPAP